MQRIPSSRRVVSVALSIVALTECAAIQQGRADQRDFPFTYSWLQASKGEKEIAFHSRYRRRDNLWQQELEFEYGLSRRFSLAPYLVVQHGDGRALHFDAWKLEERYQLGE